MEPEHYDATKIADAAGCLRRYFYKHVEGYRLPGDAIDLAFGHLMGGALEVFEKELLSGASHEQAHESALGYVLGNSVNDDGSSRFGQYHGTWRCTGTVAYRNDKGNKAKCPYSHVGKYFPPPVPEICSCGSPVEHVQLWVPHKASKDIHTLIEMLVNYMDAARDRALVPITVNGQPAVEIYAETPFFAPGMRRPVKLCVNLDAIKAFGQENYIVDYKTTAKSLDARYWSGYEPNVQVDFYSMLSDILFPDLNIRGVAIEAFSTAGATSTSFKLIQHTDEQKAETCLNTVYWLGQIQDCEDAGDWPQNKTACLFCPFQQVCKRDPAERQSVLDEKYERAKWNPQTRQLEPLPPKSNGTSLPSISTPPIPLQCLETSTASSSPGSNEAASSPFTTETSSPAPA